MTGNLVEFLLYWGSLDVAGSLLCLVKFPYDEERDDIRPFDFLSCWLTFLLVLILHSLERFIPTRNLTVQKLISSTIPLNFLAIVFMIVKCDQNSVERLSLPTSLVALLVFVLPGVMMVAQTGYLFFFTEGGGTPSPAPKTLTTQHLVIEGPYQYTRNPMVLAKAWFLLGLSLLFRSIRLGLLAVVFVSIGTAFFVYYEEPDLRNRFGQKYIDYFKNVPRWIPRSTPYHTTKKQRKSE